jgi:uncharacterized protein
MKVAEFMPVAPLSDAELDQLTELLERYRDEGAMNLEKLDGFLAAIACSPEPISQREYLEAALGGTIEPQSVPQIASLITRHQQTIAQTLEAGDVFTPTLLQDQAGVSQANDWAIGFLRGMELRRREWLPMMDDKEHGGWFVSIFALAYENHPDPEMRPYKQPMTPQRREQLIVGMAVSAMGIYRYLRARRMEAQPTIDMDTFRRGAPKVGRNDPCPCGSGKKFKQCCGRLMLH